MFANPVITGIAIGLVISAIIWVLFFAWIRIDSRPHSKDANE